MLWHQLRAGEASESVGKAEKAAVQGIIMLPDSFRSLSRPEDSRQNGRAVVTTPGLGVGLTPRPSPLPSLLASRHK
jgi:hypothetical protein